MGVSHFNSYIGALIFAKIFDDNAVRVPKYFGVLINKENIDKFLEKYRGNINYRPDQSNEL